MFETKKLIKYHLHAKLFSRSVKSTNELNMNLNSNPIN